MADSAYSTNTARLLVCRLGLVPYAEAWDLQREIAEARRHDRIPDVLLMLEHPHTYTLGRRGKAENILLTTQELAERGIEVFNVDRGGDVTYHGPGQLVGYPILKVAPGRVDYVRYIRNVEHALLEAVRDLGVPAELVENYSGVWVGDEKVCAIGVKVDAYGVSGHGFALNVNVDLSYFGHIIPCGITDKGVTSLDRLKGRRVSMARVMDVVTARIGETFERTPRGISPERLRALLERASGEARLSA